MARSTSPLPSHGGFLRVPLFLPPSLSRIPFLSQATSARFNNTRHNSRGVTVGAARLSGHCVRPVRSRDQERAAVGVYPGVRVHRGGSGYLCYHRRASGERGPLARDFPFFRRIATGGGIAAEARAVHFSLLFLRLPLPFFPYRGAPPPLLFLRFFQFYAARRS